MKGLIIAVAILVCFYLVVREVYAVHKQIKAIRSKSEEENINDSDT